MFSLTYAIFVAICPFLWEHTEGRINQGKVTLSQNYSHHFHLMHTLLSITENKTVQGKGTLIITQDEDIQGKGLSYAIVLLKNWSIGKTFFFLFTNNFISF